MIASNDLSSLLEQSQFDQSSVAAIKPLAFGSRESMARFRELVEALERTALSSDAGRDTAQKLGMCYWMLGRPQRAVEWLSKAGHTKERHYYAGLCQRDLGEHKAALHEFEQAAAQGWDAAECACERAETLVLTGDVAGAQSALDAAPAGSRASAAWHRANGRLMHARGESDEALASYERAIETDPDNARALFLAAYLYDLHGADDRALELYRRCVGQLPVYINALINLAITLEDRGLNQEAEQCLRRVLAADPNHARALLFFKDVTSSSEQLIDEEWERAAEQRNAVLDTPISEFELSVRSRNCLKKLNVATLGDLLRITEADLLAYKNFGETSLSEIKAMLTQKGLRLGQVVEQTHVSAARSAMRRPVVAGPNSDILSKPVGELELSVRSRKCLQRLNLSTVGELTSRTESDLLSIRNFGQTSLNEIRRRLAELGLSLRQPGS